MLSPNASVLVFSRCGGGETVTLKLHETGPPSTVAVQPTAVVPIAKSEPLGGVQVAGTGCEPDATGVWNVTRTALLSADPT